MYAFDVNASEFQEKVVEASHSVPIVVDYWAPWCQPCQILKPVLEKLTDEYQGKFLLARVNADENQELCMQHHIRGIPTVRAFHKGAAVNEFSGVPPEPDLRQWLDRLIPSPAEELRLRALILSADGDLAQAAGLLEQAAAIDPENHQVKIDLAELAFATGNLEAASEILDTLPMARRMDADVTGLLSRIEIAGKSKDLPDASSIEAQLQGDPDNLDTRLQLAEVYAAGQNYAGALEQLLDIVTRNRNFGDGAGRKKMLEIFTILGDQHELVRQYRRRLMTLLN